MSYTITDFKHLFETLPERYVVFEAKPPEFIMLAASDPYLQVTGKTRDQVIGKSLFAVFPDTSAKATETGKGELQTSLEAVIEHHAPDSTGVIRYDLANEEGELTLRYWQATHYPSFEDGKCVAILQSTADITDLVESNEQLRLANLKLEEAAVAGLVGSWSWDILGDVVTADKGLANLFGDEYRASQALPNPIQ